MSKRSIRAFGSLLRFERHKTGLTQGELAKKAGVATSIVNDLENGIRHAGVKTLEKLAKGLGLNENRALEFLLAGIAFSKRDHVLPVLRDYPPALFNFLPYALRRHGVWAKDVKAAHPPQEAGQPFTLELTNGKTLAVRITLQVSDIA